MKKVQGSKQEKIEKFLWECRENKIPLSNLSTTLKILQIMNANGITMTDLLTSSLEETINQEEDTNLRIEITNLLAIIGVPANIKGYNYLREAIIQNYNEKESSMMKLYSNIGKKFYTSSSAVERGIIYAIEVTWKRGNQDIINNIFGYSINPEKGKPSNCEFVYKIVDYLKLYSIKI